MPDARRPARAPLSRLRARLPARPLARLGAAAAALALLVAAPAAEAACAGASLLPRIQAEQPALYAEAARRAAATPNAEGVFWRVESPGAAPSYLFGTFHAPASEGVLPRPDAVAAMDAARILLVEITPQEQQEMQRALPADPALFADLSGRTLDDDLTPETRARLDAALRPYGMSYAAARRLQPWFVQLSLALPPCAIPALAAGEPPMDLALVSRAAAAGVAVQGLESWREALEALRALPRDMALDGLRAAVAYADEAEDLRATIAALYAEERVHLFWEISRLTSAQLLGEARAEALHARTWDGIAAARNRNFVAAATPELDRGGAFIAVGALHLPGAEGMVALLRAQGRTVTRVAPPEAR